MCDFPLVDHGFGRAHRLHRERFDDQPPLSGDKTKSLFVGQFKGFGHPLQAVDIDQKGAVGSGIPEMNLAHHLDEALFDVLGEEFFLRFCDQGIAGFLDLHQCLVIKREFQLGLANGPDIGKTHPIGREYPGKWVEKDSFHTEGISHQAGMLAAGSAKTVQGLFGYIVAALDGYLLDGVGHIFYGDSQETFGNFVR